MGIIVTIIVGFIVGLIARAIMPGNQSMGLIMTTILGIEWLASAQGIEFLRPLTSSPALERAHALLRTECPAMLTDRYLAPDIERASALVRRGALSGVFRGLAGLPALWTLG